MKDKKIEELEEVRFFFYYVHYPFNFSFPSFSLFSFSLFSFSYFFTPLVFSSTFPAPPLYLYLHHLLYFNSLLNFSFPSFSLFFFLLILFFPTSSPLLFSHLPFLPPHTYTYNYTSTLSFMFLPLQLLLSNFSLSSSSDHLTPSCFLMYLSCPCMPPPSSLLHFLFNYSCPSFPVFFFLFIFLLLFLLLLHSPLVLFPAPYDSHHALYALQASWPCVLVPVFFTGFRNIKKHRKNLTMLTIGWDRKFRAWR